MTTDTDISIRIASVDDADQIHVLLLELADLLGDQEKVSSTSQDIRDALMSKEPAVHVLLAERGDKAIGVAIFFLTFSTWRGSNGVYLQDIYVRPGKREAGSGKKLLSKLAEWAAAQGADHMRLAVDVDNVAAQSFYRHVGMSVRDDEMIFQITGRDFLRLGKQG